MSFEINPVLAGKFDVADNVAANSYVQATNASNNIQTGGAAGVSGTEDTSGVDARRYTKFDHSDTEAGSTTNFSFSDLLDMLNPLEHIPVVSSIYRAISGEDINPVARVAGDILYGGIIGAGSAVLGGVSAVADAGLEQQTGKDSGGLALAALFGPDDKKDTVQLADAGAAAIATDKATAPIASAISGPQKIELAQSAAPTPLLAALAIPANVQLPAVSADAAAATATPNVSAAPVSPVIPAAAPEALSTAVPTPAVFQPAAALAATANATPAALNLAGAGATPAEPSPLGAIPLARGKTSASGGKQPYGGVMGTPDLQAQDMAMALAQGAPGMRMGHMIYTNKLMNGPHPLPPMLSNGHAIAGPPVAVIAPAPVAAPIKFTPVSTLSPPASTLTADQPLAGASNVALAQTSVPPGALQDMMLKALGQYGKVATGTAAGPGSMLNLVN